MSGGDAAGVQPADKRRRAVSIGLFVLGMLLLIAAVWTILANAGQFRAAWASAREAPAWAIALLIGGPAVNIVLTGWSFAILTRRRGRVGDGEMIGLIWVASVLNQLPLRPGMFGRIAYHRAVNGIAVRTSVRVIVEMFACAVAANGLLLATLLIATAAGLGGYGLMVLVGGVMAALVSTAGMARAVWSDGSGSGGAWLAHAWRYPAVLAVRLADMAVWGARYALVFWIIGVPIDARGGAALACAGQAAMMAPVPMGLREWVIGATSAWLPPEFVDERRLMRGFEPADRGEAGLIARATPGLLADVVNRSAELTVGIPGAVLAAVWLGRRAGRGARSGRMEPGRVVGASKQEANSEGT